MYTGSIRLVDPYSEITGTCELTVEISNKSDAPWSSESPNPINISYHWLDENWNIVMFEGERTSLPGKVLNKDETKTANLKISPPKKDGSYILMVTLVHEGVSWFEAHKSFCIQFKVVAIRTSRSNFTKGLMPIEYYKISEIHEDQTASGLPPGVDVIVPVCDADQWIDEICQGYDELGIKPLYIVDARSSDRSLEIIKSRTNRVFTHSGKDPCVESLLYDIYEKLKSLWILRLDDDELPSRNLLAWIKTNLPSIATPSVALPRLWVKRLKNGSICTTDCEKIFGDWGYDHQIRLFQPSSVEPIQSIHTPGFKSNFYKAPKSNASIYHFDWIVRSYEERKEKLNRYENIQNGAGDKHSFYYLIEDQDQENFHFKENNDAVLASFCDKYNRKVKINKNGFWENNSETGHYSDESLCGAIVQIMSKMRLQTVLDLGCGTAYYAKELIRNGYHCDAYDGNPNTPEISGGVGYIQDLTINFELGMRYDLVMSLEVGQHIPTRYEEIYINNIISHSNSNILLSWAIPNQCGDGHVNEQTNEYIIAKLNLFGFYLNEKVSSELRKYSEKHWFKNTIMFFSK